MYEYCKGVIDKLQSNNINCKYELKTIVLRVMHLCVTRFFYAYLKRLVSD